MTQGFHIGKNRLSTAVGRWASIGPYYAMFPIPFAFDVVEKHCQPGGAVLDPFAGRGSSIYAAVTTGRYGCGIEINDVGWLYGKTKLQPASQEDVLERNEQISAKSKGIRKARLDELPEFFRLCYSPVVLRYLLAAQQWLEWETNSVDATLMAIILIYLHGAKEKSLSNQMRQGKAMAPEYSINWWRKHASNPPELQPMNFMAQRIRWRYAKGLPELHTGSILHGNSIEKLDYVKKEVDAGVIPQFDLLFTSPPYYNITSYHYDQWLRLWMLGHSNRPSKSGGEWQNGFWSKTEYTTLLETIFAKCSNIMSPKAHIWVRTDAREFTRDITIKTLKMAFPDKAMTITESPFNKSTQTALYGDKSPKPGEVDLVLQPI